MYRSTLLSPGRLTTLLRSTAVALLTLGVATTAHAQATWNPTLLVNTESFQLIDDGDGTTDVELRFGSSSFTLKYLTTGKFQFSRGISVLGTISGSSLNVDRNATIGGTLTASGAVNFQSTLTVQGNTSVKGNLSGRTLTVDQSASISGALLVKGNIATKGNLSGRTLSVDQSASISGSLLVKNNIAAKGNLSGSSIFGGGLGTCTGTNRALHYDVTTGKFTCGTISGANTGTGALQTYFDNRYVNTSGDAMTGTLSINLTTGTLALDVKQTISGGTLRVGAGGADIQGVLNASGSIRTDGDLTLGADDAATNVVLTFMNSGTDGTLTWIDAENQFQFAQGISVLGTISGSSLNVDRNATVGGTFTVSGSTTGLGNASFKANLSGQSLTVDQSATISGTLLVKTSITSKGSLSGSTFYGAGLGTCTAAGFGLQYNPSTGKFSCTNIAAGASNGSGGILSLHPEYPNAIYFASGSTSVGQMTLSGGTTALDNTYVWTSSRSTLQDYWVSVRLRLPDNFSSWDPTKPIEFRYKTGVASAANNHVTVRMRDTAGALVTLTSGDGLANTAWTTASIKGPEAAGTFAAKGYITVYVKVAANNTAGANAAAGFLNLNFETTTP
ncbi:MAG: hypothetical protein ABL890_01495 [Candidatus Peribacteraceae bacterium]